jgi:hypothetical protein
LARALLRSDESAAAYQIDVSTNRVMDRAGVEGKLPTLRLSALRLKGLGDHGILVHCDIRPAGTAEIENAIHRDGGFRTSQITCHQAPDVFRTEFARSMARAPLHFVFKRDLGSRHQDGYIIPSRRPAPSFPSGRTIGTESAGSFADGTDTLGKTEAG